MTSDSDGRRKLWLNGQIVPWEGASVHITALGSLFTIATVGEGIQAYWNNEKGRLGVFRLDDHMVRLDSSMKIQRMERRFTTEELSQAAIDTLKAEGLKEDAAINPRAFYDPSGPGSPFVEDPSSAQVMIYVGPRPSRLSDPKSIHCCVSSWTRVSDNMLPARVKCLSNYQNSRLAAWEAHLNGYDDALLLDSNGKVSEAPSACLFIVRDGVAITPPVTSGILESITRLTFLELFREELGVEAIEREIDRTELYLADEAFLCGTSAEIQPILSIDRYQLGSGKPGSLTDAIRQQYHDIVLGNNPRYEHWLRDID